MVDQKQPQQSEALDGNQPQDPDRRKFIKIFALGGVGVAALGSALLLGRNSSEQEEAAPSTTQPITNEPTTPSTSPSTTAELAPPAEVGKPAELSLDDLPSSIEDPQAWIDKIYSIMNTVYISGNYALLDYTHKGGQDRLLGAHIKDDVRQIQEALGDKIGDFRISAKVIEVISYPNSDWTDGGGSVIVEQTIYNPILVGHRLYPDGEIKSRIDYNITSPTKTTFNEGGKMEEVELYLIGGIFELCTYDKDGNCR